MPFGRSAGDVRVYGYGCYGPTEGEAVAVEAMRSRVHLWNELVALDHAYDTDKEQVLTLYLPAGVAGLPDKERRAAYKLAYQQPIFREWQSEHEAALTQEARRLGRESGLYWCNYEEVLQDWQKARRKPGALRFHSWRETDGKLTVRWQNGLPTASAFGQDTLLRLAAPQVSERDNRFQRQGKARSVVSFRAASAERKPVWLTLPVILHRPLPAGGVIRFASVVRERLGLKCRWKLLIGIDNPAGWQTRPGERSGCVAIDLGWRTRPTGLRAAYWQDDAGHCGELLLDASYTRGYATTEDLRAVRDQHFNATRAMLVAWLKAVDFAPAWLKDATKGMGLWRRQARLAALTLRWRNERFKGDEEIYAALEAWRVEDKHHYEYEANLRDRLLRQRREVYRRFAAELTSKYATIRLEEFDLAKVAKKKDDGKAKDLAPAARRLRVLTAPYSLRLAIVSAANREGVTVERVLAAYSTLVCSECGSLERFDKVVELRHTCTACGATWDQDANAAANLVSQEPKHLARV